MRCGGNLDPLGGIAKVRDDLEASGVQVNGQRVGQLGVARPQRRLSANCAAHFGALAQEKTVETQYVLEPLPGGFGCRNACMHCQDDCNQECEAQGARSVCWRSSEGSERSIARASSGPVVRGVRPGASSPHQSGKNGLHLRRAVEIQSTHYERRDAPSGRRDGPNGQGGQRGRAGWVPPHRARPAGGDPVSSDRCGSVEVAAL